MAPRKINAGDIVLYPKLSGADDVDHIASRFIGDFGGFRVVEKHDQRWIRLEPIYPDLDDFPIWLEEVSKFVDMMKAIWYPLHPGSVDGYYKVAIWTNKSK